MASEQAICPNPRCGHAIPPDSQFCAHCGQDISQPAGVGRGGAFKWVAWIIPLAAAAILYRPALDGGLVWDDGIVQKDQLVAFRLDDPKSIFFFPKNIPQWSPAYYRPMVTITYLLDRYCYGLIDPKDTSGRGALSGFADRWLPGTGPYKGPHASVLIFHLITTFFVWVFARQILRLLPFREWGALIAGIIFAVHPIHAESVCWLTGRSDTVAVMFLMPALVAAMWYRDTELKTAGLFALLLSPALFMCGLLSKEVALGGLLVLPALYLFVPRRTVRTVDANGDAESGDRIAGTGVVYRLLHVLPMFLMYASAAGVYFGLRAQAEMTTGTPLPITLPEQAQRLVQALGYYLTKVVVPAPQSAFVTDLPGIGYSATIVAVAFALLLLSIWLYRRGFPVLFIAIGWFFLTVLPSCAIALNTIAKNPVAERYLYLPSVAIALLIGGAVCAGIVRRKWAIPVVALTVAVTAAYGYQTMRRVQVWKDDFTLWSDVVSFNPDSGVPFLSLGNVLKDRGDMDKALENYRLAVERYDTAIGRGITWNSIGTVYLQRGQDKEAAESFAKAIKEFPRYYTPYFNLGVLGMRKAESRFAQSGNYDLQLLNYSRGSFQAAVTHNPTYTWAYLELGKCHMKLAAAQQADAQKSLEALQAAKTAFEKVLQLDPAGRFGREARPLLEQVNLRLQNAPAAP